MYSSLASTSSMSSLATSIVVIKCSGGRRHCPDETDVGREVWPPPRPPGGVEKIGCFVEPEKLAGTSKRPGVIAVAFVVRFTTDPSSAREAVAGCPDAPLPTEGLSPSISRLLPLALVPLAPLSEVVGTASGEVDLVTCLEKLLWSVACFLAWWALRSAILAEAEITEEEYGSVDEIGGVEMRGLDETTLDKGKADDEGVEVEAPAGASGLKTIGGAMLDWEEEDETVAIVRGMKSRDSQWRREVKVKARRRHEGREWVSREAGRGGGRGRWRRERGLVWR